MSSANRHLEVAMPIKSRDLPYELGSGSYSFTFANEGGRGLYIYNIDQAPDMDGTTVHVSAHADQEWFDTVHLSPDYGAWQRYHLYYREGTFSNAAGREHCREQGALDTWVERWTTTLDDIAAAFWNAAMARGAALDVERGSANPQRIRPDTDLDVNQELWAVDELTRRDEIVDDTVPEGESIGMVGGSWPKAYIDEVTNEEFGDVYRFAVSDGRDLVIDREVLEAAAEGRRELPSSTDWLMVMWADQQILLPAELFEQPTA
jgi:hypothetical protein